MYTFPGRMKILDEVKHEVMEKVEGVHTKRVRGKKSNFWVHSNFSLHFTQLVSC